MRRSASPLLFFMLFTLGSAGPRAQQEEAGESGEIQALRKEVEALREDQASLRRDLADIKRQLRALAASAARSRTPAAFREFDLSVAERPFKGRRDARLTLVEFSDYQCPYSARQVRETAPQLASEYVETGKVKMVFLDLPLESIHRFAFQAAEAARCAGDQGKFWEMHDQLFANYRKLAPEDLAGRGAQTRGAHSFRAVRATIERNS